MQATIDGRLAGQHALVVTPFLPVPADAGQRKRVMQFHELLRRAGCRITMLHYAVEQPFSWAHHDELHRQATAMVDELITVNAGPSFGVPPANGRSHRLDEWWDGLLAETVQRLFAKRWFDVVVVNNVWLTKVFDFVPPGATRILESHDVFSERIRALQALGLAPDFFVCERSDEEFGWNRSDVVVAISDAEQRIIASHLTRGTAVALPYAEAMSAPRRRDYLHQDKVVFGFVGSAHPFNVAGLTALIATMHDVARWAPIELVIAGEVGRAIAPADVELVTDLGYVDSPDDFYDRVDFFVSPLDFGSGLKIKVVEAISKGIPTLATAHSAIGTGLDAQLVVEDVAALGDAMARIAQRRPGLDAFADALATSQRALLESVSDGTRQLLDAIRVRQHRTVLSYAEFALDVSDPRLWVLVGMLREFANRGPVTIDLGEGAREPSWLRFMHPRVQLLGDHDGEKRPVHGDSRPRLPRKRLEGALESIVVFSSIPTYRIPVASKHVHDRRWTAQPAPEHATHVLEFDGAFRSLADDADLSVFPWWSSSIGWDPVLPKVKPVRGAPYIALLVPATDSPGQQVLLMAATHSADLPLLVFRNGADVLHCDVISALRSDPPKLVVQLGSPSTGNAVKQWCATAGVAHVTRLSARGVLDAVADMAGQNDADIRIDWSPALESVFSSR